MEMVDVPGDTGRHPKYLLEDGRRQWTEERLTTGEGTHTPGSWSPDGQVLLFADATAGKNVLAFRLTDRKVQPFLRTRFSKEPRSSRPTGAGWRIYRTSPAVRRSMFSRTRVPGKMADFDGRRNGAGLESERSRVVLPKWNQDDGCGHCHSTGTSRRVYPNRSSRVTSCGPRRSPTMTSLATDAF